MNVQLIVDNSYSMDVFSDEALVLLAEQVMALALARLDPDGVIPLWVFGSNVSGPHKVTEQGLSASPSIVRTFLEAHRGRHSTDLASALSHAIVEHETNPESARIPGLIIVQTDGVPDSERAVEQRLIAASKLNLYIAFVGYGAHASGSMRFLSRLDEGIPGQTVDNSSVFITGPDPTVHSDEVVWTELLSQIPEWRKKAAGQVHGAV